MTDGYDAMAMGIDQGAVMFQVSIKTEDGEQELKYTIPAEEASHHHKFRLVTTTSGAGTIRDVWIEGGHEEPDGPNVRFITERTWKVWPKEE